MVCVDAPVKTIPIPGGLLQRPEYWQISIDNSGNIW